jgi:hypothetical protein
MATQASTKSFRPQMLLPTQHIEDNGIFKEDKFYINNNKNKNTFLTYLPNKEERK